jgi:rod shape-determining protein MreC
VVVGDLLVTSGLGGGFPAGYPVGTVAAVKRDAAQSLADVDVRPAAALDRSRELMLAWLRPSEELPTAAAPATPAANPAPAGTAPASAGKPGVTQPAAARPAAAPTPKSTKSPAAKPPGGRTP